MFNAVKVPLNQTSGGLYVVILFIFCNTKLLALIFSGLKRYLALTPRYRYVLFRVSESIRVIDRTILYSVLKESLVFAVFLTCINY